MSIILKSLIEMLGDNESIISVNIEEWNNFGVAVIEDENGISARFDWDYKTRKWI